MEISGYPHYENVCSNILAFFFDPKKPHGLGTLFLDTIARVGSMEGGVEAIRGEIEVEREVRTGTGNFIDIVLSSDSHAILIENKIFARIGNPLDDYAAHLQKYRKKYCYKFLLTFRPVCKPDDFQNITHTQFVEEVRGLLGSYVAGADTRYLTFMLDFLTTLDYQYGGMVMNPELVEFLKNRSQDVESFLKVIDTFKQDLRGRINGLASLINVDFGSNVRQWKYRQPFGLYDILVHEVEVTQGFKIIVDTVLSPSGWSVKVFRRGRPHDRTTQDLLKHLQIQVEKEKKSGRYALPVRFEYTADLPTIAEEVSEIVCKIAGSSSDS